MTEQRQQRPQDAIRRNILIGIAVVIALTCGFGVWAATAEISGAVIAPGTVIVDSNVKKIQHLTGGVVGALYVHDGDRVKAGQILIRLDDTITRANLAIVTKELNELTARKARLEAERDGLPHIDFPTSLTEQADDPGVRQIISSERRLFELRRADRAGKKSQLREQVDQLGQQIVGLTAQQDAKQKEITLIQAELKGVHDLYQKNLVPLSRVTSLEREAARLGGERGQLIAEIAQAKGKIAELKLKIIQVDDDLSSDVAKEMRDVEAKMGEAVERKVAALDQLKRTDIRAPQDGTVFQSIADTVGGVIPPGETIMLIVPDSDKLSVEAKVNPRDIDKIKVDQRAALRFSAFDTRTTPEIFGSVSRVSADTTTNPHTGASYYTIRIRMTPEEIARLGALKLVPGMPVEAFIQTGARTLISYLMKPLSDQVARTFR
jgi:membrane fusion protein, type I secretion system